MPISVCYSLYRKPCVRRPKQGRI